VSLVITVMLSMSVFQLLVADKLPPSADATPLISKLHYVFLIVYDLRILITRLVSSNSSY
jgi:hypothetical protein